MKTMFRIVYLGRLCTAGLLFGVAGCTSVATRQPTSEIATAAGLPQNVEAPAPLTTERPEYPLDMKRAGIEGVVQITCLVDEKGGVQSVTVKDYTHPGFTGAAVDAVKKWTFTPGRRNGVTAPMRVSLPIRFVID